MNFVRTADPTADWDAYCEACDDERNAMLASAPVCEECGKSVAEADGDWCYEFGGMFYCCDCMEKHLKMIPYYD